jgi:hypothetical protein
MNSDLRERKKIATRQSVSDVATRLFESRGFETVPLTEIAAEANVSVKTIFNYFGGKEDLFFDGEPAFLNNLSEALRNRAAGTSPTNALRPLLLGGPLLDTRCPWSSIDASRYESLRNFHVCERASPTLTARRLVILHSWQQPLAVAAKASEAWGALLVGVLALRHRAVVDGLAAATPPPRLAAQIRNRVAPAITALDRAFPTA